MAITTLNLRALNRSDTASAGQLVTATSATAMDFQAAAAGGKVGQVLSAIKTDTQTTTTASYADVTGLTLAITPSATSSKILWSIGVTGNGGDQLWCKITYGDNSELTTTAIADARGSRERSMTGTLGGANSPATTSGAFQGLDSPNTTDATTYKVRFRGVASQTSYLGRAVTDTDNSSYGSNICTLTVMEILA